jgi:hypothetical protein
MYRRSPIDVFDGGFEAVVIAMSTSIPSRNLLKLAISLNDTAHPAPGQSKSFLGGSHDNLPVHVDYCYSMYAQLRPRM